MERPIIFSTPMVQAILEGRKTQTRRVIKPQPGNEATRFERFIETVDCGFEARFGNDISAAVCDRKPPYQPGDILWVRETYAEVTSLDDPFHCRGNAFAAGVNSWIYYKSDNKKLPEGFKWKPSIHMPRRAARIFLTVKNIRVERLKDISEDDVRNEGFRDSFDIKNDTFYPCGYHFVQTWDSLNVKRGYGWEKNPWVWVVEFERI